MNEQENKDDLVRRVIEQKQKTERRELTPKEKRDAEKFVVQKVLPQVYEKE